MFGPRSQKPRLAAQAVDVTENWQSEFLQFFLYIFGTVHLLQRGSPESKPVGAMHDAAGVEG